MPKPKFYVVWKGRQPGIFSTWDACHQQIHGFKGAKYKTFKTKELAEIAFKDGEQDHWGKNKSISKLTPERRKLIGDPMMDSISVDAACIAQKGIMEYQGVETATGKVIFRKGPFQDSTNNIGEFLAIVHALALMKKNGDKRPIYSDSKIAMGWVRDQQIRTSQEETSRNKQVFEMLDRALKWLEANKWPNQLLKWETKAWGEIPADFGRK